MDKHTKILIAEIPGEWTERTRSGHTNIWNGKNHDRPHHSGLPEVKLEPPEKGLYAERIDDAWYGGSVSEAEDGQSLQWYVAQGDKSAWDFYQEQRKPSQREQGEGYAS